MENTLISDVSSVVGTVRKRVICYLVDREHTNIWCIVCFRYTKTENYTLPGRGRTHWHAMYRLF